MDLFNFFLKLNRVNMLHAGFIFPSNCKNTKKFHNWLKFKTLFSHVGVTMNNLIGYQVDFVLKHYKDMSPFLRVCKTLQLSPDFFIPQDIGDDETQHSTIVDKDGPSGSTSGSSGSDNMSFICTDFVRKKRSGLFVCGRLLANKITEEENMATSMSNRRKGTPHRSPLC